MISDSEQVAQAAAVIRLHFPEPPRVGIILGTGLSSLADEIQNPVRLPFAEIPHFPRATAPAHRGECLCGRLAGVPIVALAGRCHGYEGYAAAHAALPVRVMADLGIRMLIVSNACGGMNPYYRTGDLMLVEDHINFTGANPLAGLLARDLETPVNLGELYDRELLAAAADIARAHNFTAHRGVYVGVLGPNYETRAEYRFFRRLGGDAVGMSTVHEVLVARQCGLRVLALSVVTNECRPDAIKPTGAEEVAGAAGAAEPKVRAIVAGMVARQGI